MSLCLGKVRAALSAKDYKELQIVTVMSFLLTITAFRDIINIVNQLDNFTL